MPEMLTYQREVYRKLIHISSSSIAILLWYYGKDIFLPWILLTATIVTLFDYSRKHILFIRKLYFHFFGIVTRFNEHLALTGASWIFMGAGATIYLFNEQVAVIALLVMSLSDSAAALIGMKYGQTQLFNKSLEGSIAFFTTTYFIIILLTPASLIVILLTTFIVTAIELFSTQKFNDNIFIPLATGILLTLGGIH